jgi:hypothetical protein
MFSYIISLFKRLRSTNQTKVDQILSKNSNNVKAGTVVILVPVGHHIEPAVDEALRKLESFGYTVWRKYGWSAIDQGRCAMAQEALDAGFEHLFWIDADVAFWPHDVEKIINHKLQFVSAPYTVKGWPVLTTQFKDKNVKLGEDGGLYEVNYAATGFMYTHRSVYEKMVKDLNMEKVKIWGGQYNVYPYFFPILIDGEYLGEDFAFCHRLKQIGITLYSDTRVKLSHIGKYSYSYEFLNSGVKEEPKSVNYTQNDKLKFS